MYGVAMTSRLLQIIGLFCKRALLKRLYSAKETYNFREPVNRSHPIPLTEEISLEKVGSPDYPVFLDSLLRDGDSVYSIETLREILGTPEKTCFKCTGTPMKTCWKFWQS